MQRKPSIALIYDVWNKSCSDIFEVLLKQTPLGAQGVARLIYDPERPERTARMLGRYEVIFALVGVPGRQDYDEQLHPLLDTCHQCTQSPTLTLVSHTTYLTRQSMERWEEVFPLRSYTLQHISVMPQDQAVKLKNIIPHTERSYLRRQLTNNHVGASFGLPSQHKLAMMGPVQVMHEHSW